VELNSSPYWQDLTFCYSVMPEDDGSLDGMGGDGCSVGPSSGGSFGGSPTPPSETPPTVVVWVWTCTGTDLATCQAYGASQGWILPGNFLSRSPRPLLSAQRSCRRLRLQPIVADPDERHIAAHVRPAATDAAWSPIWGASLRVCRVSVATWLAESGWSYVRSWTTPVS
jgi:hypothetical protein